MVQKQTKKSDLMDTKLASGKRLKDYTRAELEAYIKGRKAALAAEAREIERFERVALAMANGQEATAKGRMKSSLTVTLKDEGKQAIAVLQLVNEVSGVRRTGPELKAFLDGPRTIRERVSKEEAESIRKRFEGVGATVEIR
jgi:large subunit ribosomal protein L7/L12